LTIKYILIKMFQTNYNNQQYSSTNKVNFGSDNIFAKMLDGDMYLEPRLQEYYKKKKLYKKWCKFGKTISNYF